MFVTSKIMLSYCSSMILNTIKEGKIVPSEVTVKLIQNAIETSEKNRFLIDGFPRSEENRIAYERVVSSQYSHSIYQTHYTFQLQIVSNVPYPFLPCWLSVFRFLLSPIENIIHEDSCFIMPLS